MSSGTFAAAVRAATSQANPIIRRLALPWVMMTVPLTPSNGDRPASRSRTPPDAGDARAHQQVREPASPRPPELGSPQVEDEAREPLEELDHHVARDSVGHDDVGEMLGQVAALDVADEPKRRRVEQLGRALDPRIALALLLADAQQRDARRVDTQDALGEDRAHPRVLGEVLRCRVGVGTDVDEHHRPRVGDHLDGQPGPVDARQPAELEDAGRHPGTGVAGGHDRVGLAVADELRRDEDRRVLLLAQRERRVLVHADDGSGVDDADVGGQRAGDRADGVGRRRRGSARSSGCARA